MIFYSSKHHIFCMSSEMDSLHRNEEFDGCSSGCNKLLNGFKIEAIFTLEIINTQQSSRVSRGHSKWSFILHDLLNFLLFLPYGGSVSLHSHLFFLKQYKEFPETIKPQKPWGLSCTFSPWYYTRQARRSFFVFYSLLAHVCTVRRVLVRNDKVVQILQILV